ncbi:hypothetical protein AVEN_158713-1 [Araneus ventricosus]|uniref:Uncharacterized protein n=1 Tax=Araneus ventricosus TaxID=182803 RepID=A0A4Y2HW13_ARAVE|nr:hypothetical protein AVEN_158713-1 [Araneus ventricosus]
MLVMASGGGSGACGTWTDVLYPVGSRRERVGCRTAVSTSAVLCRCAGWDCFAAARRFGPDGFGQVGL